MKRSLFESIEKFEQLFFLLGAHGLFSVFSAQVQMKKHIYSFLFAAIAMTSGVSVAEAQRVSEKKMIEVNIYADVEGVDYSKDKKNPYALVALKRQVDARSPLRGALEALTGELTETERRRNLYLPVWGIKFVSVNLEKNGTAYAKFTMPEEARFSGDGSPFIFESAVELTARQFKQVKKVVVCLDGITNFGSELDEPAKKCPR